MLRIPHNVQLRAASQGPSALKWIDALPDTIALLCDQWQLSVGAALEGGTESLVLPAIQSDGVPAILKIGMPNVCNTANEAYVLQLAAGHGYAALYAQAETHNAILVEQLGSQLAQAQLPVSEQIDVICETLNTAWMPLSDSHGLMTGAEKTDWLANFILQTWSELGEPCTKQTVELARDFCAERKAAHATATCVLVHGDAHEHNLLAANGGGYKFVDPDGLYAEKACDLAVPMRGWAAELLAGDTVQLGIERCQRLADLTEVDPTAIWQWGFMERVSTGLVLLQIGLIDEGRQYLAVADIFAHANTP